MIKTKWLKLIFVALNAVSIALLGWLLGSGNLMSEGDDYDWLLMVCFLAILIDVSLGVFFVLRFLIRDSIKWIRKYRNYRFFKFSLTVICIFMLFIGGYFVGASNAGFITSSNKGAKEAYKSVVKIKTIIQNKNFGMMEIGEGSGTVISPEGRILTNYHVVSEEDSDTKKPKAAGYIICLTSDTSKAPDCDYTAKLVERNKDLDLAILQIEPIPGLSERKTFDYLEINTSDNTQIGDQITALGYPGIGQETITITQGIVSGKNDKYDQKWIKTDAVTSYGNSGGSAIDSSGKIIGIPSEAYADTLGSLGYVINVTSINQWLQDNKNKEIQDISFQDKVIVFAKKQKEVLGQTSFTNIQPNYSVTIPSDWEFSYYDENAVAMDKISDEDGGFVNIRIFRQPRSLAINDVIPVLTNALVNSDAMYFPNVVEEKDAKISGLPAKKIIYYNIGDKTEGYYLTYENNLVAIRYKNGKDDKDKDKINKIIDSIKFDQPKDRIAEVKEASNANPKFTLKTNDDWAIQSEHGKALSTMIVNKKIKEAFYYIDVETADDTNKNFTNVEYQDDLKKIVENLNLNKKELDFKFTLDELKPNVLLKKDYSDWMLDVSTMKADSTNKFISRRVNYTKKIGDKYLNIGFELFSDKPELFKQAKLKLDELIAGFNLEK